MQSSARSAAHSDVEMASPRTEDPIPNPLLSAGDDPLSLDPNIKPEEVVILEACLNKADKLDSQFIYQFAQPTFNLDVYLEQLLIQTLPPLAMLLFPTRNWVPYGFLSAKFPIIYNHILPLSTLAVVVIFAATQTLGLRDDDSFCFDGFLWVPLLFYLLHRHCIAIKYATLHPEEYKKIVTVKTWEQAQRFQHQMQLITSWSLNARTEQLLDFEIVSASVRMGCDLSCLFFSVPAEDKSAWDQYLASHRLEGQECGCGSSDSRGRKGPRVLSGANGAGLRLAAYDVVKALLVHSEKRSAQHQHTGLLFVIKYAGNILLVLIPQLFAYNCHAAPALSLAWQLLVVYITLLTAIAGIFFNTIFNFVLISATDASRRTAEALLLGRLIRFKDTDLNLAIARTEYMAASAPSAPSVSPSGAEEVAERLRRRMSSAAPLPSDDLNLTSGSHDRPTSLRRLSTFLRLPVPVPEPVVPATTRPPAAMRVGSILPEKMAHPPDVPRLDISSVHGEHNIIVWSLVRALLRNFGLRFKRRLDLNLLSCTALNVILLVLALVLGIFNVATGSKNPSVAITSPFTQQCFVSSVTLVLFVCVFVYHAARVNDQFKAHAFELHGHSLKLGLERSGAAEELRVLRLNPREQWQKGEKRGEEEADEREREREREKSIAATERRDQELERTLGALTACRDSVRTQDELLFFDFIGIRADDALLNVILTFGVTFISTFAGIYKTAGRANSQP